MNKKIKELINKFKIKVEVNPYFRKTQGEYSYGKKITVGKNPTNFTVLHEIGHVIARYGCCREHDEYIASGIAIGLAKAFDIPLEKGYHKRIDVYAGWSKHESCGAIEQRKNNEKRNSRVCKRHKT